MSLYINLRMDVFFPHYCKVEQLLTQLNAEDAFF